MFVLTDPDQQRIGLGTVRGERAGQGPHLDRVAERCSGAVRFDVSDLRRLDAGPPERGGDRRLLGFLARNGDAVGVPVLRHRRTEDLCIDLVAVIEGAGQRFDHDDGAALAAGVTVR